MIVRDMETYLSKSVAWFASLAVTMSTAAAAIAVLRTSSVFSGVFFNFSVKEL